MKILILSFISVVLLLLKLAELFHDSFLCFGFNTTLFLLLHRGTGFPLIRASPSGRFSGRVQLGGDTEQSRDTAGGLVGRLASHLDWEQYWERLRTPRRNWETTGTLRSVCCKHRRLRHTQSPPDGGAVVCVWQNHRWLQTDLAFATRTCCSFHKYSNWTWICLGVLFFILAHW